MSTQFQNTVELVQKSVQEAQFHLETLNNKSKLTKTKKQILSNFEEYYLEIRKTDRIFASHRVDVPVSFHLWKDIDCSSWTIQDYVDHLIWLKTVGKFRVISDFHKQRNGLNQLRLKYKLLHNNGRISELSIPVVAEQNTANCILYDTAKLAGLDSNTVNNRYYSKTYLFRNKDRL